MPVAVKICGIGTEDAMAAAVEGGARYVGLVFFPPSPRFLRLDDAARLAQAVPPRVKRVGVVVDESDETLASILGAVPLDMLQLHGSETPDRVTTIRNRFGLPVIKAVGIAGRDDLARARALENAADMLLFDAKPAAESGGALPGGNARAFDWDIIAGETWARPWMLSGGLNVDNLAQAVAASGAPAVDVSSGVETAPGCKDPALIRAFLARAAEL